MKVMSDNKDNSYLIYNKVKDFEDYSEKYIINAIPSVHRHIRIHFVDETYNLLHHLFLAYHDDRNNQRRKYLIECLTSVSLIDHYITKLRKIIDDHKSLKKIQLNASKLDEISYKLTIVRSLIYKWKTKIDKEISSN